MKAWELERFQLVQVKQMMLTQRNEENMQHTSYYDLAHADELISDQEVFDACYDTEFSMDDFTDYPEVRTEHKNQFEYMMLSRLKSDCLYFLGCGNRYPGCLWAGDVNDQIKEMRRLWHFFPDGEKPEWLTLDEIEDFAARMGAAV